MKDDYPDRIPAAIAYGKRLRFAVRPWNNP